MKPEKLNSVVAVSPESIANLSVISYEKLLKGDAEEASNLLSACSEWGFFYLDLTSDVAESYRTNANTFREIAIQYFSKPLEDKLKDKNEDWGTFNICGYSETAPRRPWLLYLTVDWKDTNQEAWTQATWPARRTVARDSG